MTISSAATQPAASASSEDAAIARLGIGSLGDHPVKLAGLIAGFLAAIGALVVDGEFELTLFMAVAVIGALACFDAALDRRIDAFWPWMIISVGILAKTLPTVVSRLSDHIGPDAERFDHVGAVLAGLCIAGAVFIVARPPAGAERRTHIVAIVLLCGVAGAVAGASIAFAGASGMGSNRAARVFETFGWGIGALIVAGGAIAVGGSRRLPLSLLAVVIGALGVGVLSARTASGAGVDLGWWALAFFTMAVGSLGFNHASLAQDSGRRATLTPTVVAVVGAALSVQAAILSVGDSGTWGPGVVILPLLALGLLGLGVGLYRWGGTGVEPIDEESASVFEMIADSMIDGPDIEASPLPSEPSRADARAELVEASPPPGRAASAFSGAISAPAPVSQPVPPNSGSAKPMPPIDEPAPQPAPGAEPATTPTPAPAPAPAAAVPARTSVSTEGLAPHLVDPATGLRSVAGLQALLIDLFSRPRAATEVSIVMVALRNLGTVETNHGRVAAARVTSELAQRFSSRLPDAYTARFATDAFAALIDGEALDAQSLIPRCAEVLSELLEPIIVDGTEIEIDVAASMAQCYANEDIAGFISRANTGLERAVAAAEPSLVAMP